MMSISSEYNHMAVMNHSAMTISRVRPDATDPHFSFLTVGHVESERVMILLSKTKVVLLAFQLMNMVEAGVSVRYQ